MKKSKKLKKHKLSQKQRIKNALRILQESEKLKIEVKLDNKNFNIKPLPVLWKNKFIFFIQQWIVPCHFKNWLLRRTGMKVGHDACIPHYIKFDPYFPDLIYIGAGTLIGGVSKLMTHDIKGNKLILGKIIFPEKGMVGGSTIVHPGTELKKNSILSFYSEFHGGVINEGEIWSGNPAKCIHRMNEEEINKYFKHTSENPKEYYKRFKKEVRGFLNDPSRTYFKIQYGGKRAGAGNDWWRARNVLRIFYNGVIIEITRMLGPSRLKNLLLRMVGVKMGKNCTIGKGTVFDHIYCDNIRLGNNVRIDENCYLDGHEYTIAQTVFGKTRIGNDVHIKHDSYVRTATQIGDNVTIEPNSFCQREIPANEVWGGMPAKFIRKK
ncbi:MAG: hypothetical protein N3D84_02560 [Candidatus Woesearchaeota archaeon]|nr:hypothetical protein [Candidatus Woesearchaeota archaeon]